MDPSPSTPESAQRQDSATRIVNVREAKTHLSRLINDAPGLTASRRIPGRLRAQRPLRNPDALLHPMTSEELALWETNPLLPEPPSP